jgi:hypothetical protein
MHLGEYIGHASHGKSAVDTEFNGWLTGLPRPRHPLTLTCCGFPNFFECDPSGIGPVPE